MKLIKKIDTNYYNLTKIYLQINKEKTKERNFKLLYLSVSVHKKLHYFNFFFKNKLYNFSNGQILGKKTKLTKFFKKSRKSFGASINFLNKKVKKNLNKIFFFYCKNFNYKNYLWIQKFFFLTQPSIIYAIFTRGWAYTHKCRRRIKKKILRNLIKNSNII